MKYFKLLLVFSILLFLNKGYAQFGPGGVGNSTSNGLWLKADDISQTNSTPVVTWNDASGNNNNATAAVNEQPLFVSNSSFNGMPAIRLDGINDQMVIADTDILDGTNGITIFAAIRPNNLDGAPRGILGKRITFNDAPTYAYSWFFHTSNYLNLDINNYNHNRFNSNPTNFSNTNNYLLKMGFDGSLATNQAYIYNAGSLIAQSNIPESTITNSPADLVLGGLNYNYSNRFGADYAEVIQFNYSLNLAEEIIVNNYLSAKYNISLTSNDLYTRDNSGAGNFDYHVAGIGQATDGSNHTDSQGTGIVRVSNPRDLQNDEFLFWGEESQNPTYTFSTNTITHTEQLNSVWRIGRRNNVGRVDISFDISGIDLSGKQSCQPLQLILDDDADFSMTDANDEVYDLTISGTTATATNVRMRNNRYFTIRYADEIIWNGSNFCNGSGAGNAPDHTDECLKLTVQSGTSATLTSNAHVREIEVESGATLIIDDGVLLEVEDLVHTNGIIDLQGEAQLIQNHTGTTSNCGTGILIKRQQGTSNLYNYNYWSSPVNNGGTWQIGDIEDSNGVINFHSSADADHTTTPITLSSRWLYSYNGLSNTYAIWNILTPSSALTPGIGYTMKGSGVSGVQEYIFRGIPNDGDYSIPIAAGDDILIGNPYPSALDADQFINDNLSVIDGSLYFWEQFTTNNSHNLQDYEGGYSIRNLMMGTAATADASGLTSGNGTASKPAPEQYIPVGQGFFVRASASGGNIQFNNAQRFFARESLNEAVFYKGKTKKSSAKKDERTKIWFSFTEPNIVTKQFGLGYDTNATKEYDKGYDALANEDLKNDVNWFLNGEELTIQALPSLDINDELALKIKIADEGFYRFAIDKIENLPQGLGVFLKDKNSNTYYDLNADLVEIYLEAGDYDNQFFIVFKENQSLSAETIESEKLSVFYDKNSKDIVFNNLDKFNNLKGIKLFNSIGQEVINLNSVVSNNINVSHLSEGVYIINVDTDNGVKTAKVLKF